MNRILQLQWYSPHKEKRRGLDLYHHTPLPLLSRTDYRIAPPCWLVVWLFFHFRTTRRWWEIPVVQVLWWARRDTLQNVPTEEATTYEARREEVMIWNTEIIPLSSPTISMFSFFNRASFRTRTCTSYIRSHRLLLKQNENHYPVFTFISRITPFSSAAKIYLSFGENNNWDTSVRNSVIIRSGAVVTAVSPRSTVPPSPLQAKRSLWWFSWMCHNGKDVNAYRNRHKRRLEDHTRTEPSRLELKRKSLSVEKQREVTHAACPMNRVWCWESDKVCTCSKVTLSLVECGLLERKWIRESSVAMAICD